MKSFTNYIKKPVVFIPTLIIIVIGAIYLYTHQGEKSVESVTVASGSIEEEISVTGKTKPAESVSLSFERSGRIAEVLKPVGSSVRRGEVLARLDVTESFLDLKQAQASLAGDRASLEELQKGARPEDLNISQTKVENAKKTLESSNEALYDTLRDNYTKAENAVHNYADQFFTNPRSNNPEVNLPTNDTQLKTNVNQERFKIETMLSSWKVATDALVKGSSLSGVSETLRQNLNTVRSFFDDMAQVVNVLTTASGGGYSQATLATYRSDISTARGLLNTALTNQTSAVENVRNAEASLSLAERELDLLKAGSVPEKITVAESRVKADEANVAILEHKVSVGSLRSPIDGVVTKQDAKIGEIAGVNVPLVSIISKNNFQIEANVPEADIAKLHVADMAEVTLDAYGSNSIFSAEISVIDPAETLIDNVPTYKVTFIFIDMPEPVKSGMTANIGVIVAKHENALLIPAKAITNKDSKKIVTVLGADNKTKEVEIEIGLRNLEGMVEVTNGVKAGDKILINQKN